MKDDPHPLQKWLATKKIKAWRFAATIGVSPRNLYYLLDGTRKSPGIDLMTAIAAGTKGAVSLKKQYEWLSRRAG